MDVKIRVSESVVNIFDDTEVNIKTWQLDAINNLSFLQQLLTAPENMLSDYIIESGDCFFMDIDDVFALKHADYVDMLTDKNKDKEDKSRKKDKAKENTTDVEQENNGESVNENSEKAVPASIHQCDITILDMEGNKHNYPANNDFKAVIERLVKICKEYGIKEILPVHFVVTYFDMENKELKEFFSSLKVDFFTAKKYFKAKDLLVLGVIPYSLSSFLTNLNETVDIKKPCEILMRDKEVDKIWNIMSKKNKRNAVIVGEAGVGKSALIEKITYEIRKDICPTQFQNFNVISLDVNSLIAGTHFRGDAEERIKDVIDFLKNRDNVILFIDEVHTILGAGACYEGDMSLSNALKPILARGETIVIGATTEDEYNKYFSSDAALSRRFEKVVIKEPKVKDVYPMIENKIKVLSKFHGVKITKKTVDYIILIAQCFNYEKKNPDKTLDLIDRAMVVTKRKGRTSVAKEDVLMNFDIFFEKWENMSEDSKREIAFHEMGHYIVGKMSHRLINYKYLAVSVMPAEDYLGVTVKEFDDNKVPHKDLEYYIDMIASNVAGRVAECMFTNDFTSGASADLDNATQVAFRVVTELGLASPDWKSRIYLNPMFSEKSTNEINEQVEKLINKAYSRAEEVLTENKDLLEALVREILKNKIMSEEQLDRVWKRVLKKRETKKITK